MVVVVFALAILVIVVVAAVVVVVVVVCEVVVAVLCKFPCKRRRIKRKTCPLSQRRSMKVLSDNHSLVLEPQRQNEFLI